MKQAAAPQALSPQHHETAPGISFCVQGTRLCSSFVVMAKTSVCPHQGIAKTAMQAAACQDLYQYVLCMTR